MNFNKLANTIWCSAGALALLSACDAKPKELEPKQPNIVYIMADDHAVQAISAFDHPLSKLAPTPNIDRIAKGGAMFTNSFCTNSICGPSRAVILTGKFSHVNGFMQNRGGKFDGNQPTFPKHLQKEGYETAMIGKWHLNCEPTGFDYWNVLNDQGEYYNPDFTENGVTEKKDGYVTDLITDYTINWLEEKRDKSKPFMLMMHHKAPHRNWLPAERHYNLYDTVEFPIPATYFDNYEGRRAAEEQEMNIYRDMYEGHDLKMTIAKGSDSLRYDRWPHLFKRMTDEQLATFRKAYRKKNDDFHDQNLSGKELAKWKFQRYMQDYLATIKSVDESVGRVLDYLEKQGLAENTIVVYTSDQGFYLGEHGWFDKRFMYEESFRMPLLVKYPKGIKPGTVVDELVQNVDYAPTILDFCGANVPEDMQGRSFRPLLEGEKVDDWRSSMYYHFYEHPGFHMVKRHIGVRTDRYKLIHFYNNIDTWELYDLQEDPHEMNNLYGKQGYEKLTAELKTELERLRQQYGDTDPLVTKSKIKKRKNGKKKA
ncbi:sulfatase [Marinifilum breve]|uniref:Sulfatase n=1 Tax=Marinifilum breve TaxID=2184082 RepID=A0A2V4A3P1_9BACT|nr:sulfatase [Marinifilum breve]PXY03138.1 sulfatase [Marinifilum breve]